MRSYCGGLDFPRFLFRVLGIGFRSSDLNRASQFFLPLQLNYCVIPGLAHDLGIPSGAKSPVGPRYFQLAVRITAREIDQRYEWSAHELAGRRQGLEQTVIDVVKYNRGVESLSDKDATLITFGRALFREHRVSSELAEV